MIEAAIFPFWYKSNSPFAIRKYPILYSIASLKNHYDVPVYLLDLTNNPPSIWKDIPEKHGFNLVSRSFSYDLANDNTDMLFAHRSRPKDIWKLAHQIPENVIAAIESDVVFWKSNGFSRRGLKLSTTGNSGVWYFDKTSPCIIECFQCFDNLSERFLSDKSFEHQVRMVTGTPHSHATEEIILNYMIRTQPDLFDLIPIYENFPIRKLARCDEETKRRTQVVHLAQVRTKNRVQFFHKIQDFRELVPEFMRQGASEASIYDKNFSTWLDKTFLS